MMAGLDNKVVIITGASSGIGAQTAVEFAKVGSRVVLAARRQHKLEETAQKCQQAGLDTEKVLVVPCDIMEDEDLQRLVDTTVKTYGRIDVLVNNAGQGSTTTMMTSSVEDLDRMYRMHVRAVYVLTKLSLPHLLQTKGNVVNVSSIASVRPLHYALPYSVAKCAQDQMMKAASLELGPRGVRLNSVCPGSIVTEIFNVSGYATEATLDEVMEEQARVHPAGRCGEPAEVAKVIVFLASEAASFVSGVNVPVDSARHNSSWIPPSRMPAPGPDNV